MTVPGPRRRPPGRYDEPSRLAQRSLAVVLGVLFVGLLAGIATALWSRLGAESVSGTVLSYDVVSDREVLVEVEVTKPAGATAYCLIRARGSNGAEVGRDVAVVDAAGTGEETARGRFPLATSARAVTGEVGSCRVEPLTRDDITPDRRSP
jgi:hypothetical protein